MNRFEFAHAWPGGRGLVVQALTVVVALVVALAAGCSTPEEKEDEVAEDHVIGKPPAAEEDPFFVQSMPGEAVEAAPTGSIGDEAEDEPEGAGDEVASKAPEPRDEPELEHERSQTPQQPQCFSCVRICPTDGDCDQAKDDVICGWGVHETADQAKRMAKAECDATLDMARQMPVWSEIAGDCPVATCR